MSDLLPLPPAAIRLPDLVRQHPPLVHCLTNQVVSQFTANVLLAAGAAPAMVIAREEAGDFARVASAVLVNVGTLTPVQVGAMRVARTKGGNHETIFWVANGVPTPVRILQRENGQDTLDLRLVEYQGVQ